MAIDKFSRTKFFEKNIVDGILECDLPSNGWDDFDFRRPKKFYTVVDMDIQRPDLISLKNYSVPNLWWVIMKFNDIGDVWNDLEAGMELTIPNRKDAEEYMISRKSNV